MNRTAIITGASRRIGKAMTLHLAEKGWSVAIHYNHSGKEAGELASQLLEKYPGQHFETFQANLSYPDEVLQLIPQVIAKLGTPELLINNASVFERGRLKETSPELYRRQFEVNLQAPFLLIHDFANYCKEGVIVNFVDTRITTNQSGFAAYTLSKKALWELTKMAALELAPLIRVNAIAPGVSLAPENEGEEYLRKLAEKIPMKKPGGIGPILKSLDYILENDFLTGQLLFADGGENLGNNK